MEATPCRMIKFNWDAALNSMSKSMGVGVIAHDASGAVLATMCTTVPFITDPAIAEVMGVWKAAVLCCELRIQRAIFEGDSLEVVQAL